MISKDFASTVFNFAFLAFFVGGPSNSAELNFLFLEAQDDGGARECKLSCVSMDSSLNEVSMSRFLLFTSGELALEDTHLFPSLDKKDVDR